MEILSCMVGITRELKTDQGHGIDSMPSEREVLRFLGDLQSSMWGSLLRRVSGVMRLVSRWLLPFKQYQC